MSRITTDRKDMVVVHVYITVGLWKPNNNKSMQWEKYFAITMKLLILCLKILLDLFILPVLNTTGGSNCFFFHNIFRTKDKMLMMIHSEKEKGNLLKS
jgi:hypothetical protein